jgi:hypothetical protein
MQQSVYDYGMLDDFAVAAYWAGEFRDCLTVCEQLLAGGKVPLEQRARIETNARFAEAKLAEVSIPAAGTVKDCVR